MNPVFTDQPQHQQTIEAARSLAAHRYDEERFCNLCGYVGLTFTEDLTEFPEGGWYKTTPCRCAVRAHECAVLDAAGVPTVFQEATVDAWRNTGRIDAEREVNEGTARRVRKWTENASSARADGINLWLYGSTGTGKTWLASAVLVAAMRSGFSIGFTAAASLVREAIDHKEEFDRLFHADFLLVDGVEDLPETRFGYEMTLVLDLLRHRVHHGLPTLFTSDKPLGGLPERLRRVLEPMLSGRVVESKLEGAAYRSTALTERWS